MSASEKTELGMLRKENEGLRGKLAETDTEILEDLKTLPHDEALLMFYRLRTTRRSEMVSQGPVLPRSSCTQYKPQAEAIRAGF